jgi:3-oxoacyl-[acyl-carrier protein] reductase
MFNLAGKKALVTGATGGIGEEIAKQLHNQGVAVGISGTRESKLQEIATSFGGANVHILPCNLSDKEAVKELIKQAEEKLEGLDILVCNAGITKDNLALRMSDEDFLDVIDVNLTSTFILMRAAIKGMLRRKAGRIITIGSIVGTMGNPGQANYVASKAGVAGMVKSFAFEVASRGITINNIAPGFIRTAMTDKLNEEQQKTMAERIPLGYFGDPKDIANTVSFLASDEARYITGQTIHVNGGMLMV